MKLLFILFFIPILGSSHVHGGQNPIPASTKKPSMIPTPPAARTSESACPGNTAKDRSVWCKYDINTDYELIVPDTGVTREYWLEIDQTTAAPDGVSRPVLAVNGTIPGPTIFADWGDMVVVHVTNHLERAKNGSGIHWHGMHQNYTNQNDGVVSVTQCPIAPGSTMTYRWRAGQYGSSWYHSHIGLQAWEGVFGGIVINGPATANYDEDMGPLFLNDWQHRPVDELFEGEERSNSGPPVSDNGLINGTNVIGTDTNTTGSRFTMKVDEGRSYRLRLVNAAINTHWGFGIDNHTLTVIAMDLVPIKPFTIDYISIAMGQRYDVIVTANQSSSDDSFWMRAIPQTECSENNNVDNIRGIMYYGNKSAVPADNNPSVFQNSSLPCNDEPLDFLVPYIVKDVSAPSWSSSENVTLTRSGDLNRWTLNSTSMKLSWETPTLMQVYDNVTNFAKSSGVIQLPMKDEWVYLLIDTDRAISHPIHLHGHDFFILAQGFLPWNNAINISNPPRRDTALLPRNGYLLIAFQTNNPGAWLLHCHIGWHVYEGFALQFLERYDKLQSMIDYPSLKRDCDAWCRYDQEENIPQIGSGV